MIMGSPLSMAIALRGFDRMFLGIPGWQDDADAAIALAAPLDSTSHVLAPPFEKIVGIFHASHLLILATLIYHETLESSTRQTRSMHT
jgi:hypothetical protein